MNLYSGITSDSELGDKERFIALLSNDFCPVKADAVILLEGDGFTRIEKACSLVKNGLADKLVFSGGFDNQQQGSYPFALCLPKILEYGISHEQLIYEAESMQTYQQAVNILALCNKNHWKKIILVPTHYHQYRAFLTFLKVLQLADQTEAVSIYNIPAVADWHEITPWGRRVDLLQIEFNKIIEYAAKGHVASYSEALRYIKNRK